MKTLLTTISFGFLSTFLFSQNWELLNTNKTYFYRHSDSLHIGNTIHIDSSFVDGTSETFYTAYKYKECDTCTVYPSGVNEFNSVIIHRYAPEFLGFEIVLDNENETYLFDYKTIKHQANVGATWSFSPSIVATIISIGQEEIFGELDSIKTILLSNNDTIILSQNKGLIRYPDFENEGKYFELGGYHEGQNSYGEYAPNFWTTYDFEVGDSYCLHSSFANETSWGVDWHDYQFKVLNILSDNTSIGYQVELLKRHTTQGEFGEYIYSYDNLIDTLTINYADNSFENFFGVGKGISMSENSTFYSPPFSNNYFYDYISINNNNVNVVPVSKFYFMENYGMVKDVMNYQSFGDSLLYWHPEGRTLKYANNFGRISNVENGFEWVYEENLSGAVISGDTIGNFCNFPIDLGIESQSINPLSIHPNPATSQIIIDGNYNALEIFSQTGQLVLNINKPETLIDVSKLPSGIYFLKAINEEKLYTTKLIIE